MEFRNIAPITLFFHASRQGLALLLLAVCSCAPTESAVREDVLKMHIAILRDGSEDWDAEARRRLGCDPCETFVALDRTQYLFARESALTLERSDVVSAIVLPSHSKGRRVYKLILSLTPSGVARIRSYLEPHRLMLTVNECRGEMLGVSPLALNHDRYVAGRFATRKEAVRLATAMGVPFRIEDPIPADPGADKEA